MRSKTSMLAAAGLAVLLLAGCGSKQKEAESAAATPEAPVDSGHPAAQPDAPGTADAAAGTSPSSTHETVPPPVKLQTTDLKTGTGPAIQAGQTAVVQYTGWLYSESAPDHKGEKFDSSLDHGQPFDFPLGSGPGASVSADPGCSRSCSLPCCSRSSPPCWRCR